MIDMVKMMKDSNDLVAGVSGEVRTLWENSRLTQ